MKWTKLHTGFLYLLLIVFKVFCGLPDIADAGPKILKLNNGTSGTKLTISCEVDPGILQDETLVYWLVNNSFIETAFPSGRVWMHTNDSMEYIQSDLVFSFVHPQDFQSNFTCVALSPTGVDTKSITLHEIIRNIACKKAVQEQDAQKTS